MDKFLNVLTLIFVVAKMFDVINWSWWLVFLPTFIYIAIVLLILIVAVVVAIME